MMFDSATPPPGSRPGTLVIPDDALPTRIHVVDYGAETLRESDITDPRALRAYLESPETAWVDVQGFRDEEVIRGIGEVFDLHPLTLEAALNVPQRAKVQLGPRHHLVVARVPARDDAGRIAAPQTCFLLGPNWLLTFQDRHHGFFDPIRERLRAAPNRPIRRLGASYLLYAMLDALVDLYFPVVEELSRELDELEEQIYDDRDVLPELHRVRRDLVVLRRVGWPQREAMRSLANLSDDFVSAETRVFLQSTEQHIAQVMEAADAAKDAAASLMEIQLAMVAQRTNEVMKVLTLMASIFIPLTFMAGIYGMNFEQMPELQNPYAYPSLLAVMLGTAVAMVWYFRRRGWIGRRRDDDP